MFCEFVVRKIEMYSGNSHIFDWAVEYKHTGMDWISSYFFMNFVSLVKVYTVLTDQQTEDQEIVLCLV